MTKLAVIGLGTIGQYVALEKLRSGVQVAGYEINPNKDLSAIARAGVKIAPSPEEAVRGARYVVFAVEQENIYDAMDAALRHCEPGTIVSGQTSRKTPEQAAFNEFKRKN